MASVTEIEFVQIKEEPVFSEYEEKSCESPTVKIKTEPEEPEEPIHNTVMVEIEVPPVTKIESVEVKVENVSCSYGDNIGDGEYREDKPAYLANKSLKYEPTEFDNKNICLVSTTTSVYHDGRIEQGQISFGPQVRQQDSLLIGEHADKTSDFTSTPHNAAPEEIKTSIDSTNNANKPHKCDVCMKCFSKKKQLNEHYRIHTGDKPYKCVECLKCFRQKSQLNVHSRIHTGDKPYKCDVCLNCFNQKGQLKVHYRIHTGDKPYKCDVCFKCFNNNSSYNQHIRIHTGVKPYKCDICNKSFRRKRNLNDHYTIHTGEKPYKCEVCMKCFTVKKSLNRHVHVHISDKPYKCDVCMKYFDQINSLNRHHCLFVGEKKFFCDACKTGFKYKGGLLRHIINRTCDRQP